jgi:transcriptional regulator with XRE-family HTH domain
MSPAQYRKERTQRGLTQAALAALLGVPREAVVRREAGTQPIIPEAAMALLSLPKTKAARTGKPNSHSAK